MGAGLGVTPGLRWPSRPPSVFMHLRPRIGDRAPGDPEGEGGEAAPGNVSHDLVGIIAFKLTLRTNTSFGLCIGVVDVIGRYRARNTS